MERSGEKWSGGRERGREVERSKKSGEKWSGGRERGRGEERVCVGEGKRGRLRHKHTKTIKHTPNTYHR